MDALLTGGATPPMARLARAWLAETPVTPGLGDIVLAPHQVEAVARLRDLLSEFGGAVLADETGMGKTYVALAVARDLGPCHVVAPAGLRDTWEQALARTGVRGEFTSFERLSRAPASGHCRSNGQPPNGAYATQPAAPALSPDRAPSAGHRPALVIVDEAHHVRNPRTRRYDALARLVWGTPVLLLTATPVHNRLRDLRSQLALFLGAAVDSLGAAALARLVVRRRHDALDRAPRLPAVEPVHWRGVDPAPAVLAAIMDLPPPVPPADGGTAHALLRLGLLRAWSSSDAALRATLRRRLQRAAALASALDAGRIPTQAELRAWTVVDDALQLAFPEFAADTPAPLNAAQLRDAMTAHVDGIHRLRSALAGAGDLDATRADHLRALARRHQGTPIVAFTHFAETAIGVGRRLAGEPGVAVVTARGARIASGRISRREIIARLAPGARAETERLLPLRLVLATDVLSEGLNLQRAGVLVHLDLPWTLARLEQRLGRLRRIGSPYERLHTYAIGPPVHAQELLAVVRALQRKARVVRALVGAPEIAVHEPLLGAGLRRATAEPELDLASATEELRHMLQSWCEPDDAGPQLRSLRGGGVHSDQSEAPVFEVRSLESLGATWCALALVRAGGRHRLLAIEPERVTEDPRHVLACARNWCTAVPASLGGAHREDERLADARRAIERWLAEQRAGTLAALALESPSTAHVRVVRWLDAVVARAPRHERPSVVAAVSRCRALVLAARGAGAERFLSEWVDAACNGDRSGTLEAIGALSADLGTRRLWALGERGCDSAIVTVLLLVKRDDTAGPPG